MSSGPCPQMLAWLCSLVSPLLVSLYNRQSSSEHSHMVKPESLADPLLIKMHVHAVLPSESGDQRPMDLGKKLLPS